MVGVFCFFKITSMATGTIVREPCPLRLFALNMAGLAVQRTVGTLQGKVAVKMKCSNFFVILPGPGSMAARAIASEFVAMDVQVAGAALAAGFFEF
jgi:hypothetical protein